MIMGLYCRFVVLVGMAVCIFLFQSCAGGRKLALLKDGGITAKVAVGSLDDVDYSSLQSERAASPQVVEVTDLQGNRIIMNAVKDEESGEMVATEELEEIVVVARFRHVAERNGVVDLVFELSVPMELQNRMWQVRFTPQYYVLGDTLTADMIYVTGERFRRIQNWEHSMYGNYLRKIVPQSVADTLFVRQRLLERFMARAGNTVGGEDMESLRSKAERHYRMNLMERMNANRAGAEKSVYRQFVVDPFPNGGVRLDSVVYDKSINGIRYYYVQTLKTRPGLKKVDMVMQGEVYTNGRKLCNLETTDPITFYISSISSFADETERYLKKVVYRDLDLNTSYNIEFRKNRWDIDPQFSLNGRELSSIRRNIKQVLENREYVMDSILITASGSPDGKFSLNEDVSYRRGETIRKYVSDYVAFYRDSLAKDFWNINVDASYREEEKEERNFNVGNIKVSVIPEDWDGLYSLVLNDTLLAAKGDLLALYGIDGLDAREEVLKKNKDFKYVQENLYPKLRRVKFNFKLHRKGVVKDTVHTTELDTIYMDGVAALKERDYKRAVTLLRPYNCYNTAVAFVCMDYNRSALEVLLGLPRDARRDYMLAVVYSRLGDEALAVQYYMNSVEQDDTMRHRGNLDPEISALIKKYEIFKN